MITVKQVKTDEDFKTCLMIRRKVFIKEQDVPENLEVDEFESESTHFLAFFEGKPVATGRLKVFENKVKFERISTLKEFQGKK